MQKYDIATKLAAQVGESPLSNAECDWIIEAAKAGMMVSEDEAAALIGYVLGLARVSASNSVDAVRRAIDLQ